VPDRWKREIRVSETDEMSSDKLSDRRINRGGAASWLERAERALIYVGAFGLGLGHGLIPQLLLLVTAVCRLIADSEWRRLKFGPASIALLVLTGWMMLSAITAIRPFAAWGGALGMALSGWVTLGVVNRVMIEKKERGVNLVLAFLSSACIGAIYALVNYASALAKGRGYYRAELPFVGSNAAGTIFCVAILVALGCFRSADRRSKPMMLPVIVLLTAALIATQSRGAFVAFLAGFLVFLMMGAKSRQSFAVKTAALAGLVCIVAFFFKISPSIAARYARILNPMANKDRLEIWRTALLMIRDHPLLGVGLNNFMDIYPLYQHPEGFGTSMSMAHNIFLEFGATTGIPGLALFMVIVVFGILRGIKGVITAGSSSSLPVTTLAVFVAIVTHLQFDITVDSGNTLPFFFVPYGILILLDKWLELRAKEDEYADY
jgi:putative inorganic carbon (HCO3(-)) transporter